MSSGYWRLIDEAAARSDFRPTLAFWKTLWPALVGDEIASHAAPCGWYGRTLVVEVQEGAWEAALVRAKPVILRKLADLPWPVETLELQAGHVVTGIEPRFTPRDLEQIELPEDARDVLDEAGLDRDLAELAGRIRKHLEWEKKSC